MSRQQRPIWQQQAKAAQKRDEELRKAEELKKVANYFEAYTNRSRHHEQWTTEGYYEKANREAELLSERKIKAVQLEERRKKLELMLFQENMQLQQEMKDLAAQPKFYKNGSFLNNVPTSTLKDINQGIIAKEEQLRKQEAELKLHHAWKMRQPELRAAREFINSGKCKSAWLEQIVDKELQKKQEEEDAKKILQERDEALRRQIQLEEEQLKLKELQMRELREGLEGQIAELNHKETAVKKLRKQHERETQVLEELIFISKERENELAKLLSEREATIVNMGLHKYKLKKKVASVLQEIELDLIMIERIRKAVIKDYNAEVSKTNSHARVLDSAMKQLEEYREKERQRQKNIETMYDGEARQINEKQDKLWAKEHDARASLMNEVVLTLRKQLKEKIDNNIQKQKENVLEREQILEQMDNYHKEVKTKEMETKLTNSTYSTINALQNELKSLKCKQSEIEAVAERREQLRAAVTHERSVRGELARIQREGNAWT